MVAGAASFFAAKILQTTRSMHPADDRLLARFYSAAVIILVLLLITIGSGLDEPVRVAWRSLFG